MTPLLTAFTGTPEKNQVYNLDLFDLCAAMPSGSVDMILCDLPYGTTACSWDEVIPLEPMWTAFKRVIKPRGAIVLTATDPFSIGLKVTNLAWYKYSWVWVKSNLGDIMNAKNKPMRQHEDVLIFSQGTTANKSPNRMPYYPQGLIKTNIQRGKTDNNIGKHGGSFRPHRDSYHDYVQEWTGYPSTVLNFASESGLHPTQKPVQLFQYFIRTYTQVGQVVFDPCVGSGTTAVAAREEGRSFIVGDSSLEYVEIARARLAAPYTPSFMPQLDLTA